MELTGKSYSFHVRGLPKSKGSLQPFVAGGRAVMARSKASESWEQLVRFQVQDFVGAPWEGPVSVALTFYLPRPKSLPKRVRQPATRPDIDKLVRAVLDALTGIVFGDDGQVVSLAASKRYATADVPGHPAGPGLTGMVCKP